MQSVFMLKLKALRTLDRRAQQLSYQSGPKSPPHIFFVLTNLNCFDLGTSLKKLCLSQGSDVAYIGHWTRAIYLIDRQTARLTDRQVGRHIYSAVLELTDFISPSVDMYICVSLPVNEPYKTLVSLHQYVLCGYDKVTFFLGGGGRAA